jgi:hypothetical protein
MIVVQRIIQQIYPGKNAELEALDMRWDAVEQGLGFPPKKRLWSISGGHATNTLIVERQWASMAAMEAAYEKSFANPDIQALEAEGDAIIKSSRIELYMPV